MNDKKVMRTHMTERFGKVHNYNEYPPLPDALNIELNNVCNQKCIFCDYHGKYSLCEPTPAIMEIDFVRRLIDEAWKLGVGKRELGLYLAGEPFLYLDLPAVVKYAKEKGFPYVFLTTNGVYMTPEKSIEILEAGIDSIRVSVNAVDSETYKRIHGTNDFEKVIDNIIFFDNYRKVNNIDVAISVSSVVTKKTMSNLTEIEKLLGKYVDDIIYLPMIVNRHKNKKELIEEYSIMDDLLNNYSKTDVCSILFDTMYINANKKVLLCCNAYSPDYYVWDMEKELDFEKAWNSDILRRHRKAFLEGGNGKGTICELCEFRKKNMGFDVFN